jgi:hypothetical protein
MPLARHPAVPRAPPAGGWTTEKKRLEYAEEVEAEFADPAHFGEGRTALAELQEGQVLTGTITDLWLYHGLEVDIGAEYDGLIPMQEEEWADMASLVKPGDQITVRGCGAAGGAAWRGVAGSGRGRAVLGGAAAATAAASGGAQRLARGRARTCPQPPRAAS